MLYRKEKGDFRNAGYIVGVSAPRLDAAAALLNQSGIEAAIEESKLLRLRTYNGVPQTAIRLCLHQARIDWHDVEVIAIASRPVRSWLRQAWAQTASNTFLDRPHTYCLTEVIGDSARELNVSRIVQKMSGNSGHRTIAFDHHLCHAASAFYASPFERALIVTMDEQGDGLSGAVAVGEGNRIQVLKSMSFPHSMGWVYSQITDFLGFTSHGEEHKVQWLSLYGEPVFQDVFQDMFCGSLKGILRLNLSYFKHRLGDQFSDKFYQRLGLSREKRIETRQEIAPHIASSLQHACGVLLTELLEYWRHRQNASYLCLGGGLFLNALLVASIEKNTGFRDIFVQPAAGNAGCALGAAWLAWHQVLGRARQEPVSHMYWGPRYTPDQVKEVLDNCKAPYRWFTTEAERNQETVLLLEAGKTVAWCQGAAEFGPRALGNRSLLASPWAPYVKDNLNDYIKHRKSFLPFALAVPEEDCPRYFDCSALGKFMTSMGWTKPAAQDLVRDFVLPGNCIRLHVVSRQSNPILWGLLKKFGQRAPAPFLVNTSFNLFGEPLVISPRDAVRSFFCSGVDAMLIDGFLLSKS